MRLFIIREERCRCSFKLPAYTRDLISESDHMIYFIKSASVHSHMLQQEFPKNTLGYYDFLHCIKQNVILLVYYYLQELLLFVLADYILKEISLTLSGHFKRSFIGWFSKFFNILNRHLSCLITFLKLILFLIVGCH